MIKAQFFISNDLYFSFIIKGHANFNPDGDDIICSAVSSAVDLIIDALKNVVNADFKIDVNYQQAYVNLKLNKHDNNIASMFIKSLYNHLLNISLSYPENLNIKTILC